MKVCYVLSYRSPDYTRTVVLINALKSVPSIELFEARNVTKGFIRYFETFFKFLKIRFVVNPDIYIIGFRGHEIYWFLRIFAWNKKFVFDEMMSPYASMVYERKIFLEKNIFAKILFFLEKSILKNADFILTDTDLHARYIANTFRVEKGKINSIPVGSNIDLTKVKKILAKDFGDVFTVFTYATFLPLHGMNVILKAANLLKKYPINFVIVGGKRKKKELDEFKSEIIKLDLKNVEHVEWLDFDKLVSYIKGADVCLGGPFGGTPQAKRVVTGKTYQFLSLGKPIIIGKIDEDLGFIDKKNCLLVEQCSAVNLSNAVKWCYEHKSKLCTIGSDAFSLYKERFLSFDRFIEFLK